MEALTLEKIGLTRSESFVYMALLQLGTSKTGEILTKSGLNSGKIYEILESLKSKGLVSESIINNIRHFTAAPPSQLIDYLEKKKHELNHEEKLINSMLPNLEKLRKISIGKAKSVTYTGFRGFKTSVQEAEAELKKGDEVLAMGVTENKEKRFNDFWINQFHKRRKEKKIVSKTIMSEKSYYFEELKGPYTECRIIPMITPAAVTIFGKDKVLLLNYKEPYTFTLIYDEEIATSFRNFFYQMWEEETRTFRGLEGGISAFKMMIDSMKKTDEWLGYVISPKISPKYFEKITKLHEMRGKRGLKARIILSEDSRKQGKIRTKIPHTQVRYVDYDTPTIVNVAGDITLLNVPAEKETTVIYIENKKTADSFKQQFERIWKTAKK